MDCGGVVGFTPGVNGGILSSQKIACDTTTRYVCESHKVRPERLLVAEVLWVFERFVLTLDRKHVEGGHGRCGIKEAGE